MAESLLSQLCGIPFKPQYQYAYSLHCSLYTSNGTCWENLLSLLGLMTLNVMLALTVHPIHVAWVSGPSCIESSRWERKTNIALVGIPVTLNEFINYLFLSSVRRPLFSFPVTDHFLYLFSTFREKMKNHNVRSFKCFGFSTHAKNIANILTAQGLQMSFIKIY